MRALDSLVEGIDDLIEFLEGMTEEEYSNLSLESEFEIHAAKVVLGV